MKNSGKLLFIRGLKILHFFAVLGMFAFTWAQYTAHNHIIIASRYNVFVYALYAFLLYFFCRTYNAYLIEYSRITDIVFSLTLSDTISVVMVFAITCIAWNKFHAPWYFLLLLAAQFIFTVIWAMAANKLYFRVNEPIRALVVYRNKTDLSRLSDIYRFDKKYKVERYLENPQTYEEIVEVLGDCKAVFLTGVDATVRNGITKYCAEKDIMGFFLPHVGDIILMGGHHVQAFSVPLISIQRINDYPEYLAVKRFFDIVISLLMIVLTSPIMLFTALAIRLQDGGPALYRQVRLTKGGRQFSILKFRSMVVDAEKDGVARLSTGDRDERITCVGKVIRALRLDELPQLFNILAGDMTFVGPRPERPEIAAQYEEIMPAFQLRLQVKAGLTGYAQVYGKYNTDPYDKLEMDLIYINKMNLLLDIQLMFATVRILFKKESTDGIKQGDITAVGQDKN